MTSVREAGKPLHVVVFAAVVSLVATLLSVVTPSPLDATVSDPTITVVIGTASRPNRPDQAILDRLDDTGHNYVVVDDSDLTAQMADDADFVLLTDSVLRSRVRGDIEATSTPVASMKWGIFRDLGFLERGGRSGRVGGGKTITINDPSHPLAAGFSGDVEVLTRNTAIGYANIGSEGTMVAERGMARRMRSTIFAYEEGETLSNGDIAPGRRIGTFIANSVVLRLNSNGWELFDAMIDYGLDDVVVVPNNPPEVDPQTFAVDEDAPENTVIGQVIADDPDPGDVLTYALDDESQVAIDPTTGELSVAVGATLSPGDLIVEVTVTDPGNLSDSADLTITVNDVNEAPTVDDQSFSVDEDAADGDAVGRVVATDPDGDALTYSLGDESQIAIDAATGDLTVAPGAALTPGDILLTVTVSDGPLSDFATITVTVSDVNMPPNVIDQIFSVDENAAPGTVFGQVIAGDPDPGDVLTYALDDESQVAIDRSTGELSVVNLPAPDSGGNSIGPNIVVPTFTVTVEVTDPGNLSDTATIGILVNDVNEAPTVDDQSFSVDEDAADGDAVGRVVATDPDGDALTYSLGDESQIAIDAATGDLTVAPGAALTPGDILLTVTVSDGPLSDFATITVTVSDVNMPPNAPDEQGFDVSEDAPAGTVVGQVIADDPDGDPLDFTIETNPNFEINPSTGQITVAAGANLVPGRVELVVTVTDPGLLSDTGNVIIEILNVNDDPVVTITAPADSASFTVGDTVTFTGTATDAEDGDISANIQWESDVDGALGTGASINTSSLTVGTHLISASATDSDGASDTDTITVVITEAPNNPPTVAINSPSDGESYTEGETVVFDGTAFDVEDGSLSTVIEWESDIDGSLGTGATFGASDLDVGTHTITASVTDSAGVSASESVQITIETNTAPVVTITSPSDGDVFTQGDTITFTGTANDAQEGDLSSSLGWESDSDGALGTGASFTRNDLTVGSHIISAFVADSFGDTGSDTIEITIAPAPNNPPVVADQNFSVDEDATAGEVVGTVAASDPDAGDVLNFSLDDVSNFEIDSSTGEITVAGTANLVPNTDIVLTVSVSDGEDTTDATITISVNDVPEDPTVETDDFFVAETASAGDSIGTITASDPDAGDSLTYSLDDDSNIAIDSATGELTVAPGANLVSGDVFNLTVTVEDTTARTASAPITVTVTDVNFDPVVDDQAFNVDEDAPEGALVGTVLASDPDPGDSLTFSLDDTSNFLIDENTGQITVADTANLIGGTDIVVTVSVSDGNGGTDDGVITITINDVNNPPVVDDQGFTISEDDGPGDPVGTVQANDPDGDPLTFSLDDESLIEIDANNGDMQVAAGATLTPGDIVLTVTVSDGSLSDTATITVTVTDVNDPPVVTITSPANNDNFDEGESVSFVATANDAEDGDISANLTWTSSRDGALPESGGSFSKSDLTVGFHIITAEVTDSDGATSSDQVSITIVPPNRAPVVNDQGFNAEEEATAGTVIGTVAASDPDLDTLTFSLDDTSEIDIDPSTGELTVVDVSARSIGDDITLTVTVEDPGALTDTATVTVSIGAVLINLDEVVSGEINPVGDTDTYQFTASAGTTIFFDVLDEVDNNCDTQVVITITDPSDAELDSVTVFSCASDAGPFDLTETGDYLVEVVGFSGDSGPYQFEVVTVPDDVPTAVAYDTPTTGSVATRGGTDSFTFTGAAGDVLFFDLLSETATGGSGSIYNWSVTAPSGAVLFDLDIFGTSSDGGLFTLTEAGTYTIVFDDNTLNGDDTFDFEFEIVTVPVDVPTAVAYDTPTTGSVAEPGGTDSFTFTGAAGDVLFFDLLSETATGGSGSIYNWSVTAPSGAVLFDLDIFGTSSDGGSHTLTEAGTYTIVFDDNTLNGDDTFDFEFEIVTVPVDVPTAVAYDTPTTGSVAEPGATDSFTFTGAAGDVLFFDLTSLTGTSGSIFRWSATAPSGAVLFDLTIFGTASDSGVVTLAEDGTYTIVFSDNGTAGDDTFDFEFEIVTVPVDVPTAVAYDTPTTGSVAEPGATDSFTFTGAMGDVVFFDLTSLTGTSGSIFRWSATAPSGAVLFDLTIFGTSSDGGSHTLTEDGTYTIVFSDNGTAGDDTFDFEFEIQTSP